MKVFKWSPETITDENGEQKQCPFKGIVEVEVPNYRERIKLAQDFGIKDSESGFDTADKMLGLVEKQVRSVDLKCGDMQIKSLDDLSYSREGSMVINEIGKVLLSGMPLGNG